MKKQIALLLLLVFILTGCGTQQDTPVQSTVNMTTAEIVEENNVDGTLTPKPMVSVSMPITTEETLAEDGTVLFQYAYQSMSLVVPEQEIADKIIIDFTSRIDSTADAANEIKAQAEADNAVYRRSTYLYNTIYSPMRIDQSVLSLFGKTVTFTGFTHPMYSCSGANYDMITGDVLTLGSIITGEAAIDAICQLVLAQLDDIAEEKFLTEGYENTVRQRFAGEESYDENWYFSTTGLCFFFAPYEIAPYSSGTIIAEIPYTELVGVLSDAFFSPEQDTSGGSLHLQNTDDVSWEQFTRISEVIIDHGAQKFLLYAQGSVQNVRIIAENSGSGSVYNIFAAECLQEGDAVMIEATGETLTALTLSYEIDGQVVTQPLTLE